MRVGIVALLHESNTFINRRTDLDLFRQDILLTGERIRDRFKDTEHEIGGFFAGLDVAKVEAVPILAARAVPYGPINTDAFQSLLEMMRFGIEQAGMLNGILVAPHGATVCESIPDADGHWLEELRHQVGDRVPIMGTIDAHANLSERMVRSTDCLIAYRTNPHLDQRQRGIDAANLMVRTLRGDIQPVQAAAFPRLAINIDSQLTDQPPLKPLYEIADKAMNAKTMLSNSIVLGFPYADVPEMGASVLAVADGNRDLAANEARRLAGLLWDHRKEFDRPLTGVEDALAQAESLDGPICLLDMGDNVGGGSPGDSTHLAHAIRRHNLAGGLICICDPIAVQRAQNQHVGDWVALEIGGRTDSLHGSPYAGEFVIERFHDGRFTESEVRHGGFTHYDQGPSVVVREATAPGITFLLTSRRVPPFSLRQLTSCGMEPSDYRLLVAKGVNAPLAAYETVCHSFLKVNTPGCTTADLSSLNYHDRRRPMFPFEQDC